MSAVKIITYIIIGIAAIMAISGIYSLIVDGTANLWEIIAMVVFGLAVIMFSINWSKRKRREKSDDI